MSDLQCLDVLLFWVTRGVFFNNAVGLITCTVSALWQFALYQMKAGVFPGSQIPSTLIYYARKRCLIQHIHNCFLEVKQYAFLTVYEGSAIKVFFHKSELSLLC